MFNREMKNKGAYVDTEMVALHVDAEDRDEVVEYLIATIVTKCIMECGDAPEFME